MKYYRLGLLGVLLGVLPVNADPARTPVLVELFTSEGCSSCPPADEILRRLIADQPMENVEIIGLSEHVDYWDGLGWRDPFSSARFTERQNDYARALGDPEKVYTPQMIVNGREQVLGGNVDAIRRALTTAAKEPHAALTISGKRSIAGKVAAVNIEVAEIPASLRTGKMRVVVAVVQDGIESNVLRGENANRRMTHDAVVRAMESIGDVKDGAAGSFAKEIKLKDEWTSGTLRVVAFLQDDRTRRVMGSAAAPLHVE